MNARDLDYQLGVFSKCVSLPLTKEAKFVTQAILQQNVSFIAYNAQLYGQKQIHIDDILRVSRQVEIPQFKEALQDAYKYMIASPAQPEAKD